MASVDTEHLIHELAKHKLELEAQNDELREVQETLESARREYADLYDLAPVGYFTISAKGGTISKANDAGARMLGYPKSWLLNKPFGVFVYHDDSDVFSAHRRETTLRPEPTRCLLRLKRREGRAFPAAIYSVPVSLSGRGEPTFVRMAVIDFSEQEAFDNGQRDTWQELQGALEQMKVLKSLVPVCERCRRIRDDEAYRQRLSDYVAGRSGGIPARNLCPECEASLASGQTSPPAV